MCFLRRHWDVTSTCTVCTEKHGDWCIYPLFLFLKILVNKYKANKKKTQLQNKQTKQKKRKRKLHRIKTQEKTDPQKITETKKIDITRFGWEKKCSLIES